MADSRVDEIRRGHDYDEAKARQARIKQNADRGPGLRSTASQLSFEVQSQDIVHDIEPNAHGEQQSLATQKRDLLQEPVLEGEDLFQAHIKCKLDNMSRLQSVNSLE